MIYFESGLHHHLTDGIVTYRSRVVLLIYKFGEEAFPELYKSWNEIFKDKTPDDWIELNIDDMKSAFILANYFFLLSLLFLYLEFLYLFLTKYSLIF